MNNSIVSINQSLIPFDDTYILYDPNDFLSYVLVYFSLLPMLILVFYFSWFITTRELEAVIIAGGQVINEILNNIAKNIIKQSRPAFFGDSFQKDTIRSAYGMPSAHSQFMGFFCMYWSLKVLTNWRSLSKIRKTSSILSFITATALVALSRAYLGYHSVIQVVAGVLFGSFLGSGYFIAVAIVRHIGLIEWVLSWSIIRRFWIKDSFNIASLSLADEHQAWETRRKSPQAKKNA